MRYDVKGWCPSALRPMLSGDGYLLRIRLPLGRLASPQGVGLANLARDLGSGVIELTNRANLQIRGLAEDSLNPASEILAELGLLDPARERAPSVIVSPFAQEEDYALARALEAAMIDAPELPGKFGIAVDTGPLPVLANTPADIRLERDASGQIILRLDGQDQGTPGTLDHTPQMVREVIQWYALQGGTDRMAELTRGEATRSAPFSPTQPAQMPLSPPAPGLSDRGILVGATFGRLPADAFEALAATGALRATPWRMLLREGTKPLPDHPALITSDDPVLRVSACTGAPGCAQGLQPTHALAMQTARHLAPGQSLHVSGCSKGCAHPKAADLTLVGTTKGYDLITSGTARDAPTQSGLSPAHILNLLNPERRS